MASYVAIIPRMNPNIVYLADCPEVIETLAAWHHRQWSHLNPQRTLADRIERLQRHRQRRAIPTTFVAFDAETLLGSASLIECDLRRRPELSPWLASVYAAPEHRRRGVGSALVQRVEEEARALGVERLYLFTTDRESFYARRGWRRFDEDVVGEEPIVLMSLEL